jgi:hypothetical protein
VSFVETAAELLTAFERETAAYVKGFEAAIVELEKSDSEHARASAAHLRSLMGTLKTEAHAAPRRTPELTEREPRPAAFPPEVVEPNPADLTEESLRSVDASAFGAEYERSHDIDLALYAARRALWVDGYRAAIASAVAYLQSAEARERVAAAIPTSVRCHCSNLEPTCCENCRREADRVIAALFGGA